MIFQTRIKSIAREIKVFNGLKKGAIKLLFSNLLFEVAAPMLYIFSNAFFWYKSQDLKIIVLFNLFFYIFIPLSFFINGYLLKKINIKYLAASGLILQGFAMLFFMFDIEPNVLNTFIYSSIFGLFSGIYWANRNFMEFQTTNDDDRDYFYGVYLSGATIISIIFNSFYGNFLAREGIFGVSKNSLYIIATIFVIFILFASSYLLLQGRYRNPIVKSIVLRNPDEKWKLVRKIYFLTGLRESNSFMIPTLFILYYLNTEDLLGEANSLAAIVTAIIIYILGRMIKKQGRKLVISFGIFILLINSFLILFFEPKHFAFFYNTIDATGNIFIYLAIVPIFLKQLDFQKQNNDSEFKFLFDADLFLNIGRIFGISFIYIIFNLIGDGDAIKLTPLFFILPNLLFLRNIYLVKD